MRHATRERRTFRPNDLTRAIKGVQAAGLIVRRLEFDGMWVVMDVYTPEGPSPKEPAAVNDSTGWADYK